MNYDVLIETISIIVNNESFYKNGLTLTYYLDEKIHSKLCEELYYKLNKNNKEEYEYTEEYEVEIDGLIIKFVIENNE